MWSTKASYYNYQRQSIYLTKISCFPPNLAVAIVQKCMILSKVKIILDSNLTNILTTKNCAFLLEDINKNVCK
jgi:aspartate carbamoyltransferase regulatory subunit